LIFSWCSFASLSSSFLTLYLQISCCSCPPLLPLVFARFYPKTYRRPACVVRARLRSMLFSVCSLLWLLCVIPLLLSYEPVAGELALGLHFLFSGLNTLRFRCFFFSRSLCLYLSYLLSLPSFLSLALSLSLPSALSSSPLSFR